MRTLEEQIARGCRTSGAVAPAIGVALLATVIAVIGGTACWYSDRPPHGATRSAPPLAAAACSCGGPASGARDPDRPAVGVAWRTTAADVQSQLFELKHDPCIRRGHHHAAVCSTAVATLHRRCARRG